MSDILPLIPSVPNYRVGTTLSGIVYLLDVRWNERDAAWYMSLLTEDERMIRAGMKIVLGTFIGIRSTHPDFPPGFFRAFDRSGQGEDASFDDIGDIGNDGRVVVYFFPLTELAESIVS